MIGKEVGDWTCDHCGEYSRHKRECPAPDGRCPKCRYPLDEHSLMGSTIACPKK